MVQVPMRPGAGRGLRSLGMINTTSWTLSLVCFNFIVALKRDSNRMEVEMAANENRRRKKIEAKRAKKKEKQVWTQARFIMLFGDFL